MKISKKLLSIVVATFMVISFLVTIPAGAQVPSVDSDWSTAAPIIDGNFSEGEWTNAQLLI